MERAADMLDNVSNNGITAFFRTPEMVVTLVRLHGIVETEESTATTSMGLVRLADYTCNTTAWPVETVCGLNQTELLSMNFSSLSCVLALLFIAAWKQRDMH
jgi:hypothetical protein